MDYSKFVKAVLENDQPVINKQVRVITAVLIKFLTVRLDALFEDAQDCAQNTLMIAIEKIRNDQLNNPDVIINYLFTTSKHEYFKLLSKEREVNYEDLPEHQFNKPDQLDRLVDNEKMSILKRCMEALKADYKSYIEYWFQNPDYETSVVAEHFGISVNNAWTKKHRVINVLKECFEKKF
ncbi:MAG TPA: sigma-70 family RNA polymerase sigma factor [Gracilimonas sp.]|uniref:RNA polymerase sigma factor n=1 Tax=Gracilimonas sp. TaxID=1974203 RepID=UPI002DAC8DEF|nr:sigma-70 family RNA polymerase sigma factor [Gracilimonas sp.]